MLTFGTTAFATYDPTTNTDMLTNRTISAHPAFSFEEGDLTSYDHDDRNLVINWDAKNGRGDGSTIRNANVNAKNITINADFLDPYEWENKGIISDGNKSGDGYLTHVTARGNINITTYNDAVYTQDNGSTIIDDFKNLNIKSTGEGYGLVDNGGGITVKGKTDSVVNITTEADQYHAAIGNSLLSYLADDSPDYKLGTGITIDAGQITLDSKYRSIFAGVGLNDTFAVNLNAPFSNP